MTATQVRSIRRRLGMTQLEFARLLGVGVASIYRWEHGVVAPSNMSVRALRAVKPMPTPRRSNSKVAAAA